MGRTAVAILSTQNLKHNVSVLRERAPSSKIIAMLKANGYGHGLRSVSSRLGDSVDLLGVASIDEAIALRGVGIKTPIMLAGGVFHPDEFPLVVENQFDVVFHNAQQIDWLFESQPSHKIRAWFKLNSGMGRLGFSPDQAQQHYYRLQSSPYVYSDVPILSHFACADDKENPLNQYQIDVFRNFAKSVKTSTKQSLSLCNSAAIYNFPDSHHDFVRPGLSIYGASPIGGVSASELGLKPVMTVKSSLVSVQKLSKGSSVGYAKKFICPEDMMVGVVAFGYGDGYPITARNGTPILVENRRCSLIGRVSMDLLNVDLRNYPDAKIGDSVTLWGEGLPIEEVASHTENLPYDILAGMQHRVKFTWVD